MYLPGPSPRCSSWRSNARRCAARVFVVGATILTPGRFFSTKLWFGSYWPGPTSLLWEGCAAASFHRRPPPHLPPLTRFPTTVTATLVSYAPGPTFEPSCLQAPPNGSRSLRSRRSRLRSSRVSRGGRAPSISRSRSSAVRAASSSRSLRPSSSTRALISLSGQAIDCPQISCLDRCLARASLPTACQAFPAQGILLNLFELIIQAGVLSRVPSPE